MPGLQTRRRAWLHAWLATVLVVSLSSMALADSPAETVIHPEVSRRLAALRAGPDADAYARLRELWQVWELADPLQVEEALAAYAADEANTPPLRAYAGLLEAYARRRRGDLQGATKRIARLGFVRDWLVVGPFDNDNKAGLQQAYVPELELDQPVVFDRSMTGKERAVQWRRSPDVHRWGYLDLGAMLRPQRDICAYATTYVRGKPRAITLWVGVTGAVRLFWGRDKVLEDGEYRQLDADRRVVAVSLRRGWNRLTAKVCGDESPASLSLRIGEADGDVATGLEISTSDAASTEAAALLRDQDDSKPAATPRSRAVAPLDHFERSKAAESNDPALLESFARYLMVSGADPEAQNLARDVARRAAEAAPTVERLLLAAKLAEDRNGQRELVDKAAALARTKHERGDVLLARARLARTGPNWRESFPLYSELLAAEPGRVEAVLGEVDVYVEAGLKRTALAALQRAVDAQPRSVALLRALAGQLRALGRDAEADLVEARYAMLRFDDGGYIASQLDLAVARRDADAVALWGRRLLSAEPASVWAHGVVARAQRALGSWEAAEKTYQLALQVAPEDISTMRALSDLHGTRGRRDQQVAYLEKILRIAPQAKDVRAYLEHIRPSAAREDEKYAWEPERFLDARAVSAEVKAAGHPRRTLRSLTVTTVFDNGLASHFKQVVFQPLTDEAAARSRQYAFPYHADRQVVQLRAARVFRRDGRIDEAVESGTAPLNDPSINMYTLQRTFYVQFPRLEVGDVVELRYRVDDVSARNEMSDYFGEVEYLQLDEPIASSEYVLVAPKDKKLHISVGPKPLAKLARRESVKGDQRILRFEATDVAPILQEPGMPPYGELLAHVHVSTFANWQDVGAWYWRLARDKLDVDDDVRALANRLVKGLTAPRDKVAAIYHYAASETRYVALELGIEGIRPRRAALTLARGWGDCKDKATLIVALLGVVGIDAELVLVRTGLRGRFDTTTASLAPFDHAIAYVPSLDLYLDGTAEATGTGELPAMDRSSMALRISGGKGKLVQLPEPPAATSHEEQSLQMRLAKDGTLKFDARLQTGGADAPSWRRRYHTESTRRERVASDLAHYLGPVELLGGARGLTVSDLDALEQPVTVQASGEASARKEGDGFSVAMGPTWSMVARYATRPSRTHDLLLGPESEQVHTWTLELPAGASVQSLPKAHKLESAFGTHEISVRQEGHSVTVTRRLRLDRARIRPPEYRAWRAFCEAVDAGDGAHLLISM